MSREILFFMIKPDGIHMEQKIMSLIGPLAEVISTKLYNPADMEKIKRLYEMHKGAFFYERLLNFFRGRPMKVFLLGEKKGHRYKNGFIEDIVDMVGDTDPAKAKPGSIRSISKDSIAQSIAEERAVNNLVHRSRTKEEAMKEASIFFEDLQDYCYQD